LVEQLVDLTDRGQDAIGVALCVPVRQQVAALTTTRVDPAGRAGPGFGAARSSRVVSNRFTSSGPKPTQPNLTTGLALGTNVLERATAPSTLPGFEYRMREWRHPDSHEVHWLLERRKSAQYGEDDE
jgi:hypothetical protein